MSQRISSSVSSHYTSSVDSSDEEVNSTGGSSDSESKEYSPLLNTESKGKEPLTPRRVQVLSSDDESSTEYFDFPSEGDDEERIGIEITQQPVQFTMYADLGEGFRKDADVNAYLRQKIGVAFSQLKALVVGDNSDKQVLVDINSRIVWVYEANGTASTKNLDDLMSANNEGITDEATIAANTARADKIKTAATKLMKLAGKVWPHTLSRPATNPGCKAPATAQPMKPGDVAKQGIAKEYSACAKLALKLYSSVVTIPAEQEKALQRITAAENMVNRMQKEIRSELSIQKGNLNNPAATEAEKGNARAAIAALKKHSKIHRLGLYVAVAFAGSIDLSDPQRALATADQAAKNIQGVLQIHLDEKHEEMVNEGVKTRLPKIFPDFIRGTPNLFIPKDETYAIWAATLAYSVLSKELMRKGVAEYCLREETAACEKSIEDEVVEYVVIKELNPAAVVKTPLFDEMYAAIAPRSEAFAAAHTLQSLKDGVAPILAPAPAALPAAGAAPAANVTMDARVDAIAAQYHFDMPII